MRLGRPSRSGILAAPGVFVRRTGEEARVRIRARHLAMAAAFLAGGSLSAMAQTIGLGDVPFIPGAVIPGVGVTGFGLPPYGIAPVGPGLGTTLATTPPGYSAAYGGWTPGALAGNGGGIAPVPYPFYGLYPYYALYPYNGRYPGYSGPEMAGSAASRANSAAGTLGAGESYSRFRSATVGSGGSAPLR